MLATLLLLLVASSASLSVTCHRASTAADRRLVAELRVAVFTPQLVSPYSRYTQQRVFEDTMENKTAVVVAKLGDDKVVGSADVLLVPCGGEAACYVTNVCVHPEARRCGVAQAMMGYSEVLAQELGARCLALHVGPDNAPARQLYIGLGFDIGLPAIEPAQPWVDQLDEELRSPRFVDPEGPEEVCMTKLLRAGRSRGSGKRGRGEGRTGSRAPPRGFGARA